MMLEVMAKEAKKNDLILRSSGSVNANGFDNSASVFSKRGEKWVNQDCFLVWELLMCWRHAGLARMRQDLGLLFLSCSFPRVDASRPLKRYWGSGANQRLCLPVLDPIPALAGRCSFLREVCITIYIDYTLQNPGKTRRNLCTVLGMATTGWYNRLYSVTGQVSVAKINGKVTKTFREAALLLGLLEADDNLQQCLTEVGTYQMPLALRRLLATILVHCAPNNPQVLWEKFKAPMYEDLILNKTFSHQQIEKKALQNINFFLQSMGKDIKEFKLCLDDFIKDMMTTAKE
ncbi:hypothetical protein RHGRI_015836 [Rhododendron griersonianum]|uniref:Uncharacterized protein n=1 Tax=Rhododendron griersonianum TaxID=479676 RepID=A0AAV6JSH9_9ERIC|nr:hypothetical protein RHGRI_015836 [Rhododendron griersonianum]KAG5542879.1 hypothetical protein RHGRI_015836 [Rhododendron griersonianum]